MIKVFDDLFLSIFFHRASLQFVAGQAEAEYLASVYHGSLGYSASDSANIYADNIADSI